MADENVIREDQTKNEQLALAAMKSFSNGFSGLQNSNTLQDAEFDSTTQQIVSSKSYMQLASRENQTFNAAL